MKVRRSSNSDKSHNNENKENHVIRNKDASGGKPALKTPESKQMSSAQDYHRNSDSRSYEKQGSNEHERVQSSPYSKDGLVVTEKRGNRFKNSFRDTESEELSPVIKLSRSPDEYSDNGGTIDIPIGSGFHNLDASNLATHFELELPASDETEVCSAHKKKIEAFWNDWKDTLCIDWILGDNHKQHNFEGIDKAAVKQKEIIDANTAKVLSTKKTLEKVEGRIDKFLRDLDERIETNTKSIEEVFDLVITTITKKKQDCLANMGDIKEKEEKIAADK